MYMSGDMKIKKKITISSTCKVDYLRESSRLQQQAHLGEHNCNMCEVTLSKFHPCMDREDFLASVFSFRASLEVKVE